MAKTDKKVGTIDGKQVDVVNEPTDKELALGMGEIEGPEAIEMPDGSIVPNPNRTDITKKVSSRDNIEEDER